MSPSSRERLGVDDTLQVQPDPNKEWRPSGLDLVVTSPGHGPVRWPLHQQRTRVGSRADLDLVLPDLADEHAVLHFEGEKLFVTALGPTLLNGQTVGLGELHPGDILSLGDHAVEVAGLAPPALLEAYGGEPQVWSIRPGETTIGRPGKRANLVEINHPTISRAHATLVARGDQFHLLAESEQSLCQVNGQTVTAGQRRALADGDTLALGKLMFRFRLPGAGAPVDGKLRFVSLGPLQVFRGEEPIPETGFRSQAARYVLAYLAHDWDRPVPVETLLELFWPDHPPDKARRNLNWTISTLRQTLRGGGSEERSFILRTHQSVHLDPEELGTHDLVELRAALAKGDVRTALELYKGPYLDGCYMDWALNRRTQLEQDLLAAGLAALAGEPADVLAVARKLLTIDNCCQEAYLAGMQACRQLGRPEEALRLFDTCQAVLKRELGLEPSTDLVREKLLCS